MKETELDKLFAQFKQIKTGVIGDVMLDTYMWGHVERISPEAPVPVVSLDKKELRIGGAGNVALNIQSLGAQAFVIGVTGADAEGESLRDRLSREGKLPVTDVARIPKSFNEAPQLAEIVKQGKGDKIVVFKMKRRKNYAKKQGHRQGFTEVRINDITLG